jgi:hypothetical protein
LKQLTHLEISTSGFRKSMHDDLHLIAHRPHLVQADSLNFILKIDIFDIRPRKVPTGQIILQYRRPLVKDKPPIRRKKAAGIVYRIKGNPFTGILLSV